MGSWARLATGQVGTRLGWSAGRVGFGFRANLPLPTLHPICNFNIIYIYFSKYTKQYALIWLKKSPFLSLSLPLPPSSLDLFWKLLSASFLLHHDLIHLSLPHASCFTIPFPSLLIGFFRSFLSCCFTSSFFLTQPQNAKRRTPKPPHRSLQNLRCCHHCETTTPIPQRYFLLSFISYLVASFLINLSNCFSSSHYIDFYASLPLCLLVYAVKY